MVIWTGRGWMVFVLSFGCFLGSELVTEAVLGDQSAYQRHGWPKLVGALLAALLVWVLDSFGVFGRRARVYIDRETGREVRLEAQRHTLFFIPVRYWPFVLAGLGVLLLFVGKD